MNRNGVLRWARLQWDRLSAWLCIAGGLIALIVGYFGVSGTAYTAEQIPYIVSGGLVGIFLLGLGGMLWLSADLRDEWRKLDDLDRTLLTHRLHPIIDETPVTESTPSPPMLRATART